MAAACLLATSASRGNRCRCRSPTATLRLVVASHQPRHDLCTVQAKPTPPEQVSIASAEALAVATGPECETMNEWKETRWMGCRAWEVGRLSGGHWVASFTRTRIGMSSCPRLSVRQSPTSQRPHRLPHAAETINNIRLTPTVQLFKCCKRGNAMPPLRNTSPCPIPLGSLAIWQAFKTAHFR